MGGRNPKSPQIIPSKPPKGMMGGPLGLFGGVIGGITGRGGRREPSPIGGGMEIQGGYRPDGTLYGSRRGRGRRGGGIGPRRDPIRNRLTREERMKIKAKAEERRKLRKEKGFAERGTLDKQRRPVNRLGRRRRRPMSEEERRRLMDMCPDPNMHILMADGSQKKAGDLVVGDLVKTYHEKDLKKTGKKSLVLTAGGTEKYSELREQLESSYAKATLGEYKVEFVDTIKDVKKVKLTFEDSKIICSLSHKFYVDDLWKEAKDMVVGDEVSGKKLVAIEDVEDGDVVHITIEDAHTYICEGLLSHNKGKRAPRRGRGRRGRRRKRGEFDFIIPSPGIPRDRLTGPRPRPPVSEGRGRVSDPKFPSDRPIPRPKPIGRRRRPPTAVMETTQVVVRDPTLGGAPEREVPIPKERLPKITRESDPRGPAPFAPNERAMAKERFFERMFEKADERKQQKSMMREERKRVKQSRRDESRMRMNEPGELNVGGEIKI